MQIARVDVFGYELRYAHGAYVMSGGRTITSLTSTVVRVETTDGIFGWGETCPLGPAYLEAHAGGAQAALRELGPALIGADVETVTDVMDRALRGHGYAKVSLTGSEMRTEFVCIPRPVTRSPEPGGGPLRYRVAHVAKLWKPGERPHLEVQVLEGNVGLSI